MVFWVAAVGFGRYVILLAIGLERFERFWRVLGGILGRGGRFWSLRGLASGRLESFWMVLDCILRRGGRFWSLRGLASDRSGAV